jgi:hypothetical protein
MTRKERFKTFARIVDAWSLAHLLLGALCASTVWLLDPLWSFIITIGIAILNELFECTSCGIKFCGLFEQGYEGDVFVNSLADINFNMLGWNIVLCIYNIWFVIYLPLWIFFLIVLFIIDYWLLRYR